jgi:hypothetical protein
MIEEALARVGPQHHRGNKFIEGTFPETVNQNPYMEVSGHITTR